MYRNRWVVLFVIGLLIFLSAISPVIIFLKPGAGIYDSEAIVIYFERADVVFNIFIIVALGLWQAAFVSFLIFKDIYKRIIDTGEIVSDLTEPEIQVLVLVGDGLTDTEIAHELGQTPRNIRLLLDSARSKLDAKTRGHAAVIAIRHHLID